MRKLISTLKCGLVVKFGIYRSEYSSRTIELKSFWEKSWAHAKSFSNFVIIWIKCKSKINEAKRIHITYLWNINNSAKIELEIYSCKIPYDKLIPFIKITQTFRHFSLFIKKTMPPANNHKLATYYYCSKLELIF